MDLSVNNNRNINFTSIKVPYDQCDVPLTKVLDTMEPYFELRGFGKISAEKIREKINPAQVGIGLGSDELVIVGKNNGTEEFIATRMQNADFAKSFVKDAPEDGIIMPIIDFTV